MAAPALKLIDTENGAVVPIDGSRNELLERIARLEGDLDNAERETRRHLRRIRSLEADKDRERREYVKRQEVEKVFAQWQDFCGKGRSKLTAERFDAIRARIEDGYTPAQFQLAIEGAAYDPFTTTMKNGRQMRRNDIELICREGKKLEEFACRAPRTSAQRAAPESNCNRDDG